MARIDAVTPEDVARVIDRVMAGAPRVLAAVGPSTPTSWPTVSR